MFPPTLPLSPGRQRLPAAGHHPTDRGAPFAPHRPDNSTLKLHPPCTSSYLVWRGPLSPSVTVTMFPPTLPLSPGRQRLPAAGHHPTDRGAPFAPRRPQNSTLKLHPSCHPLYHPTDRRASSHRASDHATRTL